MSAGLGRAVMCPELMVVAVTTETFFRLLAVVHLWRRVRIGSRCILRGAPRGIVGGNTGGLSLLVRRSAYALRYNTNNGFFLLDL